MAIKSILPESQTFSSKLNDAENRQEFDIKVYTLCRIHNILIQPEIGLFGIAIELLNKMQDKIEDANIS